MECISTKPQRRSVRRAVKTPCQAVSPSFELIAERVLDVSPRGMLVACDVPVALGEAVIVSFALPGDGAPTFFDAEAEVARIVYGLRLGDPGYCAGLRFTYLERPARDELLSRLAGVPPPVPQRRPVGQSVRGEFDPVLVRETVRVQRPLLPWGVFRANA